MNRARVFVVPTRFAAGIPHKAHEAAGAGLPMVCSSLIAQQLGWQDWLPHDPTPDAFARHCLDLHQDAQRWSDLRQCGLQAVKQDCDPERFRHTVCTLVADV